jgi:hypothetical protein
LCGCEIFLGHGPAKGHWRPNSTPGQDYFLERNLTEKILEIEEPAATMRANRAGYASSISWLLPVPETQICHAPLDRQFSFIFPTELNEAGDYRSSQEGPVSL